MNRATLIVLIVLVVLLLAGGFFAWQQALQLTLSVGDLGSQVGDLGSQVGDLKTRVEAAEERAVRAEERAEIAQGEAEAAEERADRSESEAEEAARLAAEEQQRAKKAFAEKEAAAEARKRAEEARKEAEERAEFAESEARLAEFEARDAKKEAERLRQQREEALDRLYEKLEAIAETRRSALGLVMNLGDSIEFDFDKAELRQENREILSRIAGVLLTAEGFSIQVFGHTDDVGSEEYNQELSESRAKAVMDYLVESGIDPEIISMRGYGKSQPLVEGTDPAARQRNRRVEIAVIQITGEFPVHPVVDGGSP